MKIFSLPCRLEGCAGEQGGANDILIDFSAKYIHFDKKYIHY